MTNTGRLIDQLAARAGPVKRLSSPLRRTAMWIALSAAIIAAITIGHSPRPGWLHDLTVPSAGIQWVASVLTGVLAAYAVFQISVPGRSPSWAWLPLPAGVLWLSGLGLGCLHDFGHMGMSAFAFEGASWQCAWAITLISVPLGLVLLLMVRHAGVVRPGPTAMLTAISAAALSSAGVDVFHAGETALMVLLWHAGAVLLLSVVSWLSGSQLFAWIGYARR